jgi:O-antigen/teichoic acid export membrane protein
VERLARGTRDNVGGIVVERLLGLVLFASLPFLLTPTDLGVYYEATALVALLAVVATLGLDTALVRFAAVRAGNELSALRSALRLALVAGSLLSALIVVALWAAAPALARVFHAEGFASALRIGAPAIPFLVATSLLVAPARGMKRMGPTVVAVQVVQPAAQLGASLVLIALGAGVRGAMLGLSLSAVGACLVAAVLLRRAGLPQAARAAPRRSLRPLVAFSLPVLAMSLTGTALLWMDTLILGAFRPAAEVATYGVIVRLLTAGSVAMVAVIPIFGPFAAQLARAGDRDRLGAILRTATRWALLLGGPILAFLAIASSELVALFRQASPSGPAALTVLALAFLLDTFCGPVGHVLTMSGRSALNFADNAAALVVNVALNLLLVPRFGLVGAAVSWSVAIVGVNAARVIQVRRLFGVSPFGRALVTPALAIGIASATALTERVALDRGGAPSWVRLAAIGVVFVATYLLALVGLGLGPEDRVLARAAVGRSAPAAAPAEGTG